MPVHPAASCLTALLLLPAGTAFAWPHDPAVNVPVCTAAGNQTYTHSIPDGSGGLFVTWIDSRSGAEHVYAQHLGADGTPLWTPTGVAVTAVGNSKGAAVITSDGVGGVVIAWQDPRNGDYDIYIQRLNGLGTALWTPSGVRVTTAAGNQTDPSIIGDEAGGAYLVWIDSRNFGVTSYDIYAQHLDSGGFAMGTSGGEIVCDAAGIQNFPLVVRDAYGLPVVAWNDYRTGVGDIFAQRLSGTGSGIWAVNGNNVTANASTQLDARIVADAAGGTVLAWTDYRNSTPDIYAQRLTFTGTENWGGADLAVCTAAGTQQSPVLASDGQAGAFVFWQDARTGAGGDIYGQHVVAATTDWPADGVLACDAIGLQTPLGAIHDGFGGAVAMWRDERSGVPHLYSQRVRSNGFAMWTADGVQLAAAIGGQVSGGVVADGRGGAVAVFTDTRYFASFSDLYAQGVDRFGYLAPEPSIASVKDVPNDQGGQVKVSWNASPLDTDPLYYNISEYQVFRSVPTSAAAVRSRLGARVVPMADFDAGRDAGALIFTAAGFWEYAGSEVARQLSGYSHVTTTTGDSVDGSNPLTKFMVRASGYSPSIGYVWWESAADSAYSVDDLAPAAPAPFTGQYAPGNVRLHWDPNTEADLAGYRLYRGTTLGFEIGPGSLVAALTDTGYVDGTSQPYYYKLTAVDVHGNESPVSRLAPEGVLDAPGPTIVPASFAKPRPNPAAGGTALRFGIAVAGRVRLEILDAAGRSVRTLVDATYPAGEHALRWDGRDTAGRTVSPGIYFARIAGPALGATHRIAVVSR